MNFAAVFAWGCTVAKEFDGRAYDATCVTALRFYLYQPSPNWRSFGLRDVMCYALLEGPQYIPPPKLDVSRFLAEVQHHQS
jgi:hypothetical protein